MKRGNLVRLLAAFILFSICTSSSAQNLVNWTKDELMEPSQLAKLMQEKKPLPIIYSIGPGAVILHSTDIGSIKEQENMQEFRKQLSKLPKDANIVVYCGCCPFEHCPNVRPAVAALKEMKFTNFRLLDLEHNVKTDWLDKRYPSVH